jgi:hypothetical protein
VKESLARKETLFAVFVDFRSVYDSVWRMKFRDKSQKLSDIINERK